MGAEVGPCHTNLFHLIPVKSACKAGEGEREGRERPLVAASGSTQHLWGNVRRGKRKEEELIFLYGAVRPQTTSDNKTSGMSKLGGEEQSGRERLKDKVK